MSGRHDPPRWSTAAPAELPEAFVKAARGYREQGPSSEKHAEMWRKLEGSVGHAVGKSWYAGWAGVGIAAIAALWMGWSLRSAAPLMAAGARAGAVLAPPSAAALSGRAKEQTRFGRERVAPQLDVDESRAGDFAERVDPRGAALAAPLTAAGSDGAERQGSMTGGADAGNRPPMAAASQVGRRRADARDGAAARSATVAADAGRRPPMAAASRAGLRLGTAPARSPALASEAGPRPPMAAGSGSGSLRAEARESGDSVSGRVALAHERAATPPPSAAAPEELELLMQARRLLRTNPERALELAERHRAEYPRGTFAEERELLAIEALRGLGRGELAAARATRFHAQFPGSPHARRVDALSGRE